ncbi:uncharacterized protein LOC114789363 isoform X2 [Denticeps clupeoides]|uniref:uncharacterized protein LOC114789363 isoform X2 n=1 Tax=Denticeps clupeoides TaxID=299321 RepID=UPI0010A43719|nr:uncharacterized protein LOC114789363 isoform X2 [Denticeps clupeoides]
MKKVRRKGGNKEKVFGCDLAEHISVSCQDIPVVLRSCSEFIEENGIVDGIYRLSGVSSNTQKLRAEFESEGLPDLKKEVYLQDIHCVSSLCKAYFRELPNPLLTYQLYDRFAEAVAVQLEEERLVKIKEVLKDLNPLHLRTLEYLMRHLVKMANFSSQTNMHARNLAIVWAPNLLRSKDIEASGFNGTAAFMEVRVQSIVVEFILTHVPQLFPETEVTTERRKSLPSPNLLTNQDDSFFKAIPFQFPGNMSPGDGPPPMRPYHAIIEPTDKRKGSLKGRKWKSIFNLGGRLPDPRKKNKGSTKEKEKQSLRPAKSMDSLSPGPFDGNHQRAPPTQLLTTSTGVEGGAPGIGGAVSSGYAVKFRPKGGACVIAVSGVTGTPGTYNRLDTGEGPLGTDGQSALTQSVTKSPAVASRAERRAGMHISGPFSVTVPLHITSGLALGVLHRDKEDDEPNTSTEDEGETQVKEKETDRREKSRELSDEKKVQSEAAIEKAKSVEEEEIDRSTECEGGAKGERLERDISDEKLTEEQLSSGEEPGTSINGDLNSEEEMVEPEGDYMDMKSCLTISEIVDGPEVPSDLPHLVQQDSQDLDLPLDLQDTFGFLDLIDSGTSYQQNEFSVEPPCCDEDEYEEEQHLLYYASEAQKETTLQHTPETDLTTQTRIPPSMHRRMSSKSQSLPYNSTPLFSSVTITSPSDEEDVDTSEPSDYDEDDEDKDDMFYQSLPADLLFHGTSWTGAVSSENTDICVVSKLQESDQTVVTSCAVSQLIDSDEPHNSNDLCVNHSNVSDLESHGQGAVGCEKTQGIESPGQPETDGTHIPSADWDTHSIDQSNNPESEMINHADNSESNGRNAKTEDISGAGAGLQPATISEYMIDRQMTESEDEVTNTGTNAEEDDVLLPQDVHIEEHHPPIHVQRDFLVDDTETCCDDAVSETEESGSSSTAAAPSASAAVTSSASPEMNEASGAFLLELDTKRTGGWSERQKSTESEKNDQVCESVGGNTSEKKEGEEGKGDSKGETEEEWVGVDNSQEPSKDKPENYSNEGTQEEEEDKEEDISQKKDAMEAERRDEAVEEKNKGSCCGGDSRGGENVGKENQKRESSEDLGPGVGRTLVVSKHWAPKTHHAKAVPIVPPKPQHSRLTALNLRQQLQQRDMQAQHPDVRDVQQREQRDPQIHQDARRAEKQRHRDPPNTENRGAEKVEGRADQVGEKENGTQKRQDKPGREGEKNGDRDGKRDSLGPWDAEKDRRRDEAKRNSGVSICFDEAVARATREREKEKEKVERDKERERVPECQEE